MAPKVSDSHAEARREQILLAAMNCFAENGFHKTSVKDICRAANLSPGAVYSYFESKDDIIAALCQMGDEMNDNMFKFATSQDYASPQAAYVSALSLFISQYKSPMFQTAARMDAMFLAEALSNKTLAKHGTGNYQRIIDHIREMVTESQQQGAIDSSLDASGIAQVLFSLVQGLSAQILMNGDQKMDLDAYSDAVNAFISGKLFTDGQKS